MARKQRVITCIMQFIDTNIFIRHLTRDDPNKAQACRALFQKANTGDIYLTTSESVIAEVVFVLSSKRLYNLSRDQVRSLLYPLLTLQGLNLAHRTTYLRALDIFASSNLDYEDALTIAHMERRKLKELFSYDQGFDHLRHKDVVRQEP